MNVDERKKTTHVKRKSRQTSIDRGLWPAVDIHCFDSFLAAVRATFESFASRFAASFARLRGVLSSREVACLRPDDARSSSSDESGQIKLSREMRSRRAIVSAISLETRTTTVPSALGGRDDRSSRETAADDDDDEEDDEEEEVESMERGTRFEKLDDDDDDDDEKGASSRADEADGGHFDAVLE